MTASIYVAAAFCFTATIIHCASTAIAIHRLRRSGSEKRLFNTRSVLPVSLVRPVCGIDNYGFETLSSTFSLDYPHCEILFCVAAADDPVVPLVRSLIAAHPSADARLLIGDERVSNNPKLNNVLKGWHAARNDWIIIADSNVLMPPDYIRRLFASWRTDTGLVASPPIGCLPQGLWAELECAFLNTYQARWQYVADALGFGFAQGKTMLWRRADLESAGGIEALANEAAEDAASTKIVRGAGLKVRLIDRPLAQPLGHRTAAEFWNRQVRWARLRRATFFAYFLPEAISGGVPPMVALAFVTYATGLPVITSVVCFGVIWYAIEMLARSNCRLASFAAFSNVQAGPRPAVACSFRDRAVWRRFCLARQRNAGRAHAAARDDGARAAAARRTGAARPCTAARVARTDVVIFRFLVRCDVRRF